MKTKLILLSLVSLLVIAAGVSLGSTTIPFRDTVSAISSKLFGISLGAISENDAVIIWELRLPRVLLAFLVGGALSCSGAVVQSVLKNPLASPYTLGVSSGAAFGAGLVIIAGVTVPILGGFLLPMTGLLFGLVTVIAGVTFASKIDKNLSGNTIVLAGMVFSLFINSILTVLSTMNRESLQRIILWQMGSFSMRGWDYVAGFVPFFAVCALLLFLYNRELDILSFGEDQAKAIGVDTKKVKWVLLSLSAILSGSAVAFCGVIGFVDLVVPHLMRAVFGSKHRLIIPASILFGGCFMVTADLIARTVIPPSELPVGAITALAGAPFFAVLYFKKSKKV